MNKILNKLILYRSTRFFIVGLTNTVFSFSLLNIAVYIFGFNKIISNILATSCAILLSFVLNRRFVFAHTGDWKRQIATFVPVTLSGSLLLNNLLFTTLLVSLEHNTFSIIYTLRNISPVNVSTDFIIVNASAAIATLFGMIWNYNGYKYFVFKKENQDRQVLQETV
jgi:putative flippase GtrA